MELEEFNLARSTKILISVIGTRDNNLVNKKALNITGYISLTVVFAFFGISVNAQNEHDQEMLSSGVQTCNDEQIFYSVKEGDMLHRIASSFGSYRFWEVIYIANADLLPNPNLIYPGQKLLIPQNIANYKEGKMELEAVLKDPFCKPTKVPLDKIDESYFLSKNIDELLSRLEAYEEEIAEKIAVVDQAVVANQDEQVKDVDEEQLEKLRDLFKAVVEEENDKQKEQEKDLLNVMDGMVYDETRSKIGKDFYDVFYSSWQAPEDVNNFSIKILETPGPSLGTVVSIVINDSEIFKTRLQPRYETIQDAGKYATRVAYSYLEKNKNKQVQIY